MEQLVTAARVRRYDVEAVLAALPDEAFEQVRPGDRVVLKPNWVMQSHKDRPSQWEYVITHPAVMTAVLRRVLDRLRRGDSIVITDGPQTDASFRELIAHYPVDEWRAMSSARGVDLAIVDLRDCEWQKHHDITIGRRDLPGDPRGKTEVDLVDDLSEFFQHLKSRRGYYGADYDRAETNRAHDGHHNRYRVSRTVLECDVFVNVPKLKTHRKSGITGCLKNLVGINTHKNFLPHHSEGGPSEGGDQFPKNNVNARVEGPLLGMLKQHVLRNDRLARWLSPLNTLGKRVFGDTRDVIRSGNWHGNDTLWRTILDLNKVLLYANADGTLRDQLPANAKRYIGVVDAIVAGEGNGPLAPDPVDMHYLFWGTNPVAIDATAATLMGFDPARIPAIARAFEIARYPLARFGREDIRVRLDGIEHELRRIPATAVVPFTPHFGWVGHIERADDGAVAHG